jgi:hypothetical protein
MNKKLRQQEVVSYLLNCNYHEFMTIMRQVLPAREENGIREGSHPVKYLWDLRLVICLMGRETKSRDVEQGKHRIWKRWHVEDFLAYPHFYYPEDIDIAGGWPLEQSGECRPCKVRFSAATKGAVCPLCGDDLGLT